MEHINKTLEVRQNYLKTEYNFYCHCVACVKDYPVYESLAPIEPKIPHVSITPKTVLYTQVADKDIQTILKEITQHLKNHEVHYPCKELIYAQEIYKMWNGIRVGSIPFKFMFNHVPFVLFDDFFV